MKKFFDHIPVVFGYLRNLLEAAAIGALVSHLLFIDIQYWGLIAIPFIFQKASASKFGLTWLSIAHFGIMWHIIWLFLPLHLFFAITPIFYVKYFISEKVKEEYELATGDNLSQFIKRK